MAILSRDEILSANDRKTKTVSVPEWGGDVIVSVMSGEQRDAYEGLIMQIGPDGKGVHKLDNLRAKLLSCCIVDESGDPLFSVSDVAALGRKSASALQRVYQAATEINAVTEDAVEESAKNS